LILLWIEKVIAACVGMAADRQGQLAVAVDEISASPDNSASFAPSTDARESR